MGKHHGRFGMSELSELGKKKILLTGFNGLLGSWLVDDLLKLNCHITGVAKDDSTNHILLNKDILKNIDTFYFNIVNYEKLLDIFNENDFDLVIHLAAQTQVTEALLDPIDTFETNIKGTWNILELCRLNNIPIVFASSDKAYGDSEVLPYKEHFPLSGNFPYEVSKSSADLIASTYKNTYDLKIITLRCGNIFGGGDLNWDRLIPGVIRSLLHEKTPILRSTGEFIRDWVYVKDVSRAYIKVSESLLGGKNNFSEYNFSSSTVKKVSEIYDLICQKISGEYIEPTYKISSDKEIKNQYLDNSRIQNDIKIENIFFLEESMDFTIEWYKEYFQSLNN